MQESIRKIKENIDEEVWSNFFALVFQISIISLYTRCVAM